MKFAVKINVNVSPVFKQFITIICCDSLVFAFTILFGWATINSVELQDKNSAFPTGSLSLHEVSLVISYIYIGCLTGNFAVIPCVQSFGPKRTIHLCSIPLILAAMLMIYAQNTYYLYASRVLTGLVAGAMPYAVSTLINEICFSNIRGTLNALSDASLNFGCIVSFLLGNYLSCMDQAKVSLIVPCISAVVLFLFPESPEHLANYGKEQQKNESLKFYQGIGNDIENNHGQFTITDVRGNVISEGVANSHTDGTSNTKLTFNDFKTTQAKKACFIAFTSYILSSLCGTYLLLVYVAEIFTRTGSPISAKSSSLVISIVTLLGNLSFLPIADRFSRKSLYVSSAIITAVWFFAFGGYCLIWLRQPGYDWMPLLCFACINFFSSMGLLSIPYIISTEIFPKKIRSICLPSVICSVFIVLCVYSTIFPIFLESIELYWCMFFLGTVCLLNAMFGIRFMPDTRGKSYEEILEMLSK